MEQKKADLQVVIRDASCLLQMYQANIVHDDVSAEETFTKVVKCVDNLLTKSKNVMDK